MLRDMASWSDFEAAAPDLARQVRERFDAHTHKTMATLRRDGSPRISGTETRIEDGELLIGSMWQARKALDLQRDPRIAIHSGSDDPPDWHGDAKVAGVAEEITDGGAAGDEPSHTFRIDLREVSAVRLSDDRKRLVIEIWTPDGGVRRMERA
jgi:hypothetical protein